MKYLPAVALFGTIAAVYTICCTPDFTWINADCDGFYYYAKSVHLVDWGTNPVFASIGYAATRLPLGDMPWRAAFFTSTLPAIITSMLIFLAVRKQTQNKYAPYVGAAAFAASPIVISQATVHEVYSMAAMFCVAAYLMHVYKKHSLSVVMLGLAFCTHWLTVLVVVVAFVFWVPDKRKLLILTPFLAAPFALERFWGIYNMSDYWLLLPTVMMHGRLTDLPIRFLDTLQILIIGFGLAWLPAVLYLRDWKKAFPFLIILGFPVFHLMTSAAIESYVQLYVAAPFVAVAAGLGIERLYVRQLAPVVLVGSCIALAALPAFWDVGRASDENPTTARQWFDQIEAVPDGSVILCSRRLDEIEDTVGMLARSTVEVVNREKSKGLYWINPGAYLAEDDSLGERERLRSLGFATPYVEFRAEFDHNSFQDANMLAFAEANPNTSVYRTVVVEPKVFRCELVKL